MRQLPCAAAQTARAGRLLRNEADHRGLHPAIKSTVTVQLFFREVTEPRTGPQRTSRRRGCGFYHTRDEWEQGRVGKITQSLDANLESHLNPLSGLSPVNG